MIAFATKEDASRAAFDLLTCSTIDRYVRMARRAAARSRLRSILLADPSRIEDVLSEARALLSELRRLGQRDVPEVGLATILACLAERADGRRVNELLLDVAVDVRPAMTWVSALARRLIHERREVTSFEVRSDAVRTPSEFSVENPVASKEDVGSTHLSTPRAVAPKNLVA